jgi:hypothetical protein
VAGFYSAAVRTSDRFRGPLCLRESQEALWKQEGAKSCAGTWAEPGTATAGGRLAHRRFREIVREGLSGSDPYLITPSKEGGVEEGNFPQALNSAARSTPAWSAPKAKGIVVSTLANGRRPNLR